MAMYHHVFSYCVKFVEVLGVSQRQITLCVQKAVMLLPVVFGVNVVDA